MKRKVTIQKGFQSKVFYCDCDIAVIGGAMGAGKSYALLLDIISHVHDKHYRAGVFRYQRTTLLSSGGLWEELGLLCDSVGIKYRTNKQELKYIFPSGAQVEMRCGNIPDFKSRMKGAQYTAIFIDEADEFGFEEFKFLIARLRSKSETKPYMRITTNPSTGWLKELIQPYLKDTDYPDSEKVGKKYYLYFMGNKPIIKTKKQCFVDESSLTKEDLKDLKTFTFIAGKVTENKKLLEVNPHYLSNLKTLPEHERDRYLYGWWGELPKDGLFQENQFDSYIGIPENPDRCIITCDPAFAGKVTSDQTAATCWMLKDNELYLIDMIAGRWKYAEAKQRIISFIKDHEEYVESFYIEDFQGASGLLEELRSETFEDVYIRPIRRDGRISKVKRAYMAANFFRYGIVRLPLDHADMRKKFLREVCAFSADMTHKHDDISDTFFDACLLLGKTVKNKAKKQQEIQPRVINQIGSASELLFTKN